jgi:hypothetical protein
MKTIIETTLKNDKTSDTKTWSVLLDVEELARIVKATGLDGGNQALDSFVQKFVLQFKQNLSEYINR